MTCEPNKMNDYTKNDWLDLWRAEEKICMQFEIVRDKKVNPVKHEHTINVFWTCVEN